MSTESMVTQAALEPCPLCGTEMHDHGHCFSHPRPTKGDCVLRHYSFAKEHRAAWNTRTAAQPEREAERFLTAYVSQDGKVVGIEHETVADWNEVRAAHVALRDRINERLAEEDNCPFKPDVAQPEREAVEPVAWAPTSFRGEGYVYRRKEDAETLTGPATPLYDSRALTTTTPAAEREAVLEEALRTASLRFTEYAELHADKLLDGSLSEAQRQTIRGKVDRNLRYAAEARAALKTTPAPAVSIDEICEGCPPVGYPTDKTRCDPCPRRVSTDEIAAVLEAGDRLADVARWYGGAPGREAIAAWKAAIRSGDAG